MLEAIKNLFGIDKTDYAALVKQGALILDVRSKSEYSGGHIKNSINIPVNELQNNLSKLKSKDQTIITCCASGMRSASAKSILINNGYQNVHNGGGWNSLNNKL
ncbi:rhodanese-like domain-containing protein [Chryseobacterium aquaticum]|uniref:Rhodanese-like domain-containing protein n=1 Tax=Chryseobacterium aquaticum TaxID=452084 RepID=A0A848NCG4_9FLAO|nr:MULTISPECIES: rhodanese-like domain-containing protein [Chryseobacterium]NMR36079.1 rhodanese-like domain-containing protein [Chryseobacterium aquaticum]NRQ48154.1 rhodanese-like domain-containing protein [Chryseobacterium sp. C-204]